MYPLHSKFPLIPPPPICRTPCLSSSGDLTHSSPCLALVRLTEKVSALEQWRLSAESDLKEIRQVIAQVKLLMSLSIGGGGLSLLSLLILLVDLINR